jgi:hypothetical protein
LPGRPLDRVVTITTFILIRTKLAGGGVTSANILYYDCIPAFHGMLECGVFLERELFTVGSAVYQDGKGAITMGPEDVRAECDAVTHRHSNVMVDNERRRGRRVL